MTDHNSDVQQRIDQYLDAIDRTLAGEGLSRTERRHVTDDVENQVRDMLAERAGGAATVADIDAVLAELDAPEAYAQGGDSYEKTATPESKTFSWERRLDDGSLSVTLAMFGLPVYFTGVVFRVMNMTIPAVFVIEVVAMVLAVMARSTKWGRLAIALSSLMMGVLVLATHTF